MVFDLHGITKREIQTATGDSMCMVEFVDRGRVIDMTIYSDHLKETVIGTTTPYQKSGLHAHTTMNTIADKIIRESGMSADDSTAVQEQIAFITAYYEAPIDKHSEDPSEFRGCKIPAPFRMTADGVMVNKPTKDDPNNEVILTSTPLYITACGENVDNDDQWYEVALETVRGKNYTGWKKQGDLLSKPGITDLMNKGLITTESSVKDINAYLMELIANNGKELTMQIMASSYGWKKEFTQFIIGNVAISHDRTDRCLMDEGDEETSMNTSDGCLSAWVQGVGPVLNNDLARFKCYAMAAAPIIEIMGNHSFLVEHIGPSGSGKTTTALIARSMFTNPKLLDPTSTSRGIEKVGAKYGSIGLIFDETRAVNDFQKAVYNMINVNSRATSDKEQNLRESKRTNTVIMTTSESSLLHDNAYEGIQARVLTLTDTLPNMPLEVPMAEKAVKANYGLIGPLFIRKVMQYMDLLIPRYNKFINSIPDSDVAQAGRRKAHFALMAVAGNILEDVFKDIGMDNPELDGIIEQKKASEVCTKYFNEAVQENAFEAQEIQALRLCYAQTFINPRAFYREECTEKGTTTLIKTGIDRNVMGWISEDRIDFQKDALSAFLSDNGQVGLKQSLKLWKAMDVLNLQGNDGRTTYNALKQGNSDKTVRTATISFIKSRVEHFLGLSDGYLTGRDEMSATELSGVLKADVQSFCDDVLGYEMYNGEVMDIAKGVWDHNANSYESRGIALEDVIEAIVEMRLN